jgi:hypothetical protein
MVVINYFIDSTNGLDTNNGLSSTSAFLTIEHAISVAADNDNIILMPGTHTYNLGVITKNNITIRGLDTNTCILALASSDYYICNAINTELTIKNCTITSGGSAAIINSRGSLKVFDCVFQKHVSGNGNAIKNDTTCLIIDCSFQDFTTPILNSSTGTITIIGCVFNNSSSAAITNETNGIYKIHECSFKNTHDILNNCSVTPFEKIEETEYQIKQFYRKMLTNLLIKGVAVTGEEKLTTLANKILLIKLSSKLTLTYSSNILKATLVDINTNPIKNATINIVDIDNNIIDSGVTDNTGIFSKTYAGSTSTSVHAVYEGSDSYYSSNSGNYISIMK